jgi:hAT family C-terminal dimerisation region
VLSDVIPVDWWQGYRHQFPCIAQLVRIWLCVTALSTPSEIVLLGCSVVLTANCSRLDGNVLRDQVMINRNACCHTKTEDDIRAQFLKTK